MSIKRLIKKAKFKYLIFDHDNAIRTIASLEIAVLLFITAFLMMNEDRFLLFFKLGIPFFIYAFSKTAGVAPFIKTHSYLLFQLGVVILTIVIYFPFIHGANFSAPALLKFIYTYFVFSTIVNTTIFIALMIKNEIEFRKREKSQQPD